MSDYPYHTGSSFIRDPGRYAHDAFGHTGADDAGIRAACFRQIPHTGIDVSPKRVGDSSARVVSPVFGTIVRAGFDAEAGNYHIIKHDDYAEWWIGGHHSAFAKTSGHVDRGDHIANMGATGGAKGVHVHWTVATSLAAALAYVSGWVQYRNGRSVASWARQAIRGTDQRMHGLVDPWPLIEREWADEVRRREAERQAAAQAAADRARAEADAAARREEGELMGARDEIIRALSDPTGFVLLDCGPDGLLPNEQAAHAVLIHDDGPLVLHPPARVGLGQIESLRLGDYRWIPAEGWAQRMTSGRFLNRVKDTLTMRNYFGHGRQVTSEEAAQWIADREAEKAKGH